MNCKPTPEESSSSLWSDKIEGGVARRDVGNAAMERYARKGGLVLSEKRRQEMLDVLYEKMDSTFARSRITRVLECIWKGVALLFILLCAYWLVLPSGQHHKSNTHVSASTEQLQEEQGAFMKRCRLDLELYEMDCDLEGAISRMEELVDKDLTGF